MDSIINTKDTLKVFLNPGEQFFWKSLQPGNIPKQWEKRVSYRFKSFQNTVFNYKTLHLFIKSLLQIAENEGYPFAQIKLDSLAFEKNLVSASLYYDPGLPIDIDSLKIKGDLRLKNWFLEEYLQIKRGDLFDQSKINRIDQLLKVLAFVKLQRPSQVRFKNYKASIDIFANQYKSNEIDGILGLLPNELEPGSVLLTGVFNIKLRNLFGVAQNFETEFQQTRPRNQILNIKYKYPFFLRTPLDLEFNFNLLREDTNFININRELKIGYNFYEKGMFNIQTGLRTSQLGFTPLQDSSSVLPVSETRYLYYGLGYDYNNLDDIFLPHTGLRLSITALIGNKEVKKLPFIPDSVYKENNIENKTLQLNLRTTIEYYLPLLKKSVALFKISGAKLFNPVLFRNELYRLGGLQSLRGHNQNNFFASAFIVSTLEYRYFWSQEGYFFTFLDQGILEEKIFRDTQINAPTGIGTGISFQTQAGVFTLVYALGRDRIQNFSVTRSQIHFGFTSKF